MSEEIKNPSRYTKNSIECWDFVIKYQLDFLMASITKYIWRHKYKNGIEDLEKAMIFLQKRKDTPIWFGALNIGMIGYQVPKQEDFPDFDNRQFELIQLCANIPVAISLGENVFKEEIEKIEYKLNQYIKYQKVKLGDSSTLE